LRLLQDVSSKTGLLPKDYWISEVEEGERIAIGGEAEIFRGFLLRNSKREVIALRKILNNAAEVSLDCVLCRSCCSDIVSILIL
jgi:hypothetical protein